MMLEFRNPFPVVTPLGEGYALYVTAAGMWENDSWCVVLDDGSMRHFTTNQLRYVGNGSYDIKRPRPLQVPETPEPKPTRPERAPFDVLNPKEAGHADRPETGGPVGVVNPPGAVAGPPLNHLEGPGYHSLCGYAGGHVLRSFRAVDCPACLLIMKPEVAKAP